MFSPRPLPFLLLLLACGDKDPDTDEGHGFHSGSSGGEGTSDGADGATDGASDGTDGGSPEGWWFSTCGDPVCRGYVGPTEGIDICTDQTEGEPCSPLDATCDREDDCNTFFVCALEDPKAQPGGCPISLRASKTDIHHLSDKERQEAAKLAMNIPLSTWRYKTDPPSAPERLGFVIEDLESGVHPALRPEAGRVDLYGLGSLTLAAVQYQAKEMERLEAERAAQEERIRILQAQHEALTTRMIELERKLSELPAGVPSPPAP